MPANKSSDPLTSLSVRFPFSLVQKLRVQSVQSGVTVSDVLRSHLTLAEARPLSKPVPRRRPKHLAPVSGADPALLRQLAGMGSNLNQIAHQINACALAGEALPALRLLTELQQIERHLRAISDHQKG